MIGWDQISVSLEKANYIYIYILIPLVNVTYGWVGPCSLLSFIGTQFEQNYENVNFTVILITILFLFGIVCDFYQFIKFGTRYPYINYHYKRI